MTNMWQTLVGYTWGDNWMAQQELADIQVGVYSLRKAGLTRGETHCEWQVADVLIAALKGTTHSVACGICAI